MRRQLSTYIDPEARPADRKLLQVLERQAAGKRSVSRAIYDALLDHFGIVPEAARVSTLPGMENVYPGRITAQRAGLATVRVADRDVYAASRLPPRTRVFVSVRAHSIALALSRPTERSTIRNVLPARVHRVVELDEIAYVDTVTGKLAMRATVTPASVRSLGVSAGHEVWLLFKALSVKLTPR